MYTVKQLSNLAGITVRTLHHYDAVGLLKPSRTGANGYRYYGERAVLRLQQILFYREMDLDLLQIKRILDDGSFDLETALHAHRQSLQEKIDRLQILIHTVDSTIKHLKGEEEMSQEKIFEGFNPEKQKEYEEKATQLWGSRVTESTERWNSYGEQKQQAILQEGKAIYADILAVMPLGPESPQVQACLARWHQHLRYFYEPTLEVLRGLGALYQENPDFNATFTAMHPDLPGFLSQAIGCYVDRLEQI